MTFTNETVRRMFSQELLQLQAWFLYDFKLPESEIFLSDYRIVHADILGAQFTNEEPAGGKQFDFKPTGRKYQLSNDFTLAWAKRCQELNLSLNYCRAMIHLFLVHEFYHIHQFLTSDRYQDSSYAPRGLQSIDYLADACAIRGIFKLYDRHKCWQDLNLKDVPWNRKLAELIRIAVHTMEVFDVFSQGNFPITSMDDMERFLRYVQWHFQYVRAFNFCHDNVELEAFGLIDMPIIDSEIGIDFLTNGSTSENCIPSRLKFFITWRGRLYRFMSDDESFAKNLRNGIFKSDFVLSSEAIRVFLAGYPDLTGRDLIQVSKASITALEFSTSLNEKLKAVKEYASKYRVPVRSPHLLLELLNSGEVAYECFNKLVNGYGQKVQQGVKSKVDSLQKEPESGGFKEFDWFDRDEVRTAYIIALQEGASEISSKHLFLGLLLAKSTTALNLRKDLEEEKFNQLVEIAYAYTEKSTQSFRTP